MSGQSIDDLLSDASQPHLKRIKTDDSTHSPTSVSSMTHASSYLAQSHFQNPYQPAYPQSQSPFSYPQQSYLPHHYASNQQQMSPHYQQHALPPQALHGYSMPPISPTATRKRVGNEMDTPMDSTLSMTPMSSYSLSSQPMLGGHPGHAGIGPGSGLGISTIPSQGLDGELHGHLDLTQMPVKKGRTNTPWTPAEEQRLKQMREAGKSWSEIAKTFPNRTEGSVKKHWYKDMHYAEFTEDEGSFKVALTNAIRDYEQNKWKVIGQKVGKPAKACEQFAREHLNKS